MRLKFSVEQDSFDESIRKCMRHLFETSEYSDVTIVCDDNKLLKCHKFILCEYSQVFKSVLSGSEIKNPAIEIREASYNHLKSLMEFLYTGVTAVSCSDIKDISKIAFKFQVNNWLAVFQTEEMALMENNKSLLHPLIKETRATTIAPKNEKVIKKIINDLQIMDGSTVVEKLHTFEANKEKSLSIRKLNNQVVAPTEDHKDKSRSYKCSRCLEYFDDHQKLLSHILICANYVCFRCNHIAISQSELKNHTIEKHRYSLEQCTICNKFVNKTNLSNHKATHRVVQEPKEKKCNNCDYICRNRGELRQHKRIKHNGVQYPCTYCDYKAASRTHFQNHVNSIHKGTKFPCPHCEYKATATRNLKAHIEFVHTKIRIQCHQCGYLTQRKDQLAKHINKNHTI